MRMTKKMNCYIIISLLLIAIPFKTSSAKILPGCHSYSTDSATSTGNELRNDWFNWARFYAHCLKVR